MKLEWLKAEEKACH